MSQNVLCVCATWTRVIRQIWEKWVSLLLGLKTEKKHVRSGRFPVTAQKMDTWYPKPIWKRAREMQENIFHILLCIGPINNEFQKFQLLFKNLIFKVKYILDVKQIFLFVCFILEFLPCEIWKRIYSLCIPGKYRLQNFTRSESPSSGFETCLDHLMLLFNPQATGFLFVEGGALERNTAWVSPCWAAWGCT